MAQKITTTKVLRHHMSLKNGGSRYIDIDNPIDDAQVIKINISNLNTKINENDAILGRLSKILVSDEFFNGDSDAYVTACTAAEIIETQKIVTTTEVSL